MRNKEDWWRGEEGREDWEGGEKVGEGGLKVRNQFFTHANQRIVNISYAAGLNDFNYIYI